MPAGCLVGAFLLVAGQGDAMTDAGLLQASGGTRTVLALVLVGLVVWFALSGVFVFAMTAMGVGSCSSTEDGPQRAARAMVVSVAVHVLAVVVTLVLVLRSMAMTPRLLVLAALAVGVPVATFTGSLRMATRR